MSADVDLWLDGNALAGALAEALGAELTTAPRRCGSCGTRSLLAEHRLYRGAGLVLRCPACGDLALLIAELPDRWVLHLVGAWRLQLPRG